MCLRQMLSIVLISKSTWWEGCEAGCFPKIVKLRLRITAWRVEDITALMKILANRERGSHDFAHHTVRDIRCGSYRVSCLS
ncbi:MAG: hypothetical protein LBV77_05080 [Candidatus Adiutrix intracellularis]|nr:hypothetical protein [Candidatus Adiutrix intracellularis]